MISSDTERKSGAIPRGWGEAFGPFFLSRSPSLVCGTFPASGAKFNGKRYHLFAAQMLTGSLEFAFSGLSGETGEEIRGAGSP